MNWARMLVYITGTVDQELLVRNEYLAAENRILKAQIKGRLLLSEADKATLAEIAHRLEQNQSRYISELRGEVSWGWRSSRRQRHAATLFG
jgi:hypothetical protein